MLVESLWKAAMWRCHRWSLIERMSKLHQLAPRNQFMVKYSNVWILFNIFKLYALSSITQCKMEWTIGRRLRYKRGWSERGGGWSKMDGSRSDGGALTQWSSVLDRFDLWGHSGLTQPSIIAEMKKNAEPMLSIYYSLVWSSPFALLYLNTFKRLHKL